MTTFPVLANSENVFYIQPIAQGSGAAARAIASALFYRYVGINSGFGSTLEDASTPLQTLQAILAEWLFVYAHLQTAGPALTMTKLSHILQDPFIGTDTSPEVSLAASGTHVPSCVSLLGFLSDWVGSVAPATLTLRCGNVHAVTAPIIRSLGLIRPAALPADTPVFKAYLEGSKLEPHALVARLNVMFTATATPHPTTIVVAAGISETTVRVRSLSQKQQSVLPPVDFSDYPAALTVTLPGEIEVEAVHSEELGAARGTTTLVCSTPSGAWFPVYPIELSDAVLQGVAVTASAEVLVASIEVSAPSFAEFREVASKAILLNGGFSAAEVKQAVKVAFLDRFPSSPVSSHHTNADGETVLTTVTTTSVTTAKASVPDNEEVAVSGVPKEIILKDANKVMTLYFVNRKFSTLQLRLKAVTDFFSETRLVQWREGGGKKMYAIANASDHVLADAQPRSGGAGTQKILDIHPRTVAVPLGTDFADLSTRPCVTVVFTREDLLAIALSGKRSRALLKALWKLRGPSVIGSNFDYAVSTAIITEVLENGVRCLRQAARWMRGVLAEIIIDAQHAERVAALAAELYESLDVFVLESGERTLVAKKTAHHACLEFLVHSELVESRNSDSNSDSDSDDSSIRPSAELLLKKLTTPPILLSIEEVDSLSEPSLVGILITSCQVALLRGLGDSALCDQLLQILKAVDSEDINASELASVMRKDTRALKRALLSK